MVFFPDSHYGCLVTEEKVAQSCPTHCDTMDCTVHGIPQTRILEWVAFPFFKGSFPNQGSNPGLPHCRQILYHLSHKGGPGEVGDIINEVLFNYFFFFPRKIRVPICTPSTVLNQRLQNKQGLKEMGKEKNVIYFLKYTERMSSLLLPWEP